MATIVTRAGKGTLLTNNEIDANFNNLNSDKVETSAIGTAAALDTGILNGNIPIIGAGNKLPESILPAIASTILDLTDTTITTLGTGELLKWDGSAWVNNTLIEAGITHNALNGFVANEHIDWTTDQGAVNIDPGNYVNVLYNITDNSNATFLTVDVDENAVFDSQLSVGGVPVSPWLSPIYGVQAGNAVIAGNGAANTSYLTHNLYFDGAWKRIASGFATLTFMSASGEIKLFSAGTGAADSVAAITENLSINSDGSIDSLKGFDGLTNLAGNKITTNTSTPSATQVLTAISATASTWQTLPSASLVGISDSATATVLTLTDASSTFSRQLDIWDGNNALVIGAESAAFSRGNNTAKVGRIVVPHFSNAEEEFTLLVGVSTITDNIFYIGGGSGTLNSATSLRFHTAANNTTTIGTVQMNIDNGGLITSLKGFDGLTNLAGNKVATNTSTPSLGQVLTATSATTATWQTGSEGYNITDNSDANWLTVGADEYAAFTAGISAFGVSRLHTTTVANNTTLLDLQHPNAVTGVAIDFSIGTGVAAGTTPLGRISHNALGSGKSEMNFYVQTNSVANVLGLKILGEGAGFPESTFTGKLFVDGDFRADQVFSYGRVIGKSSSTNSISSGLELQQPNAFAGTSIDFTIQGGVDDTVGTSMGSITHELLNSQFTAMEFLVKSNNTANVSALRFLGSAASTEVSATFSGDVTMLNLTSTGIDDNATATALTLNASQNATFAGDINAQNGYFLTPSANTIVYSTGGDGWGAFYPRGSGTNSSYIFMGNQTTGERARLSADNAGGLIIGTNGSITALTLDASQNATFAGSIVTSSIIRTNNSSAGGGIQSKKNDTTNVTIMQLFSDDNLYIDAPNQIRFRTNGSTTALTLDASQNATFVGNVVIANGKGIDFAAVGGSAAGSTASLLDDYEEGTWIPSVAGGVTSSHSIYTKVGRMVTVTTTLVTMASTGGVVLITGLPFTPLNTGYTSFPVLSQFFGRANYWTIVGWLNAANGQLSFWGSNHGTQDGSAWVQLQHTDFTTTSNQVVITLTYPAN